jgi:hypothetical protein
MTIAILTGLCALATFGSIAANEKWPAILFMVATLVLAVVG